MGSKFIFSILSLEDFKFHDIFGKIGELGNLGKEGQIRLFDISVLNYVIKELLKHFGCIGNENL